MGFEYDIFISHSSDDKTEFAAELVEILLGMDTKVWYADFQLKPGDSLSKAIEQGLMNSRFGAIVLSKSFLKKKWTEYEFRTLLTLEMYGINKIIPIWLNVSKRELLNYCPIILDKLAIDATNKKVGQVAYELLKIVNPDAYNHISRKLLYLQAVNNSELKRVNVKDINDSPIRREGFHKTFDNRLKIIHTAFGKYLIPSFEKFREGFLKDIYPEDELCIWEAMFLTFEELKDYFGKDHSELEIAMSVLCVSMENDDTIAQKESPLIRHTFKVFRKYMDKAE